MLLHWLVRGVLAGEPLLLLWSATANSLFVSGTAAVLAAVCSVPVAVMVVRHPGKFSHLIERMSFTGFALPGIVVALALVFFAVNYARPVYQTVWLLVFAYVVLFLPAALGATRAALLKVSPSLEDAARGLGRTPAQTMRVVTAPLIAPGIVMGAALVFLIAMKELPATLIPGTVGVQDACDRCLVGLDGGVLRAGGGPGAAADRDILDTNGFSRDTRFRGVDLCRERRPMNTYAVRCTGLTKRYDDVVAVDGIELAVQPGEALSIVGPSGSGKTTTLRLIAGFEAVDEGEISLRGAVVSGRKAHVPPERRSVGIVFQEHALFPHKTVGENVAFGLHKLGSDERSVRLERGAGTGAAHSP